MLQLKLSGAVMLTLIYVCSAHAQYSGLVPEAPELELGWGTAMFYDSQIQNTTNAGRPNLVHLTYYQPYVNLSLKAGYDFMTAFNVGDYQLSTNFFFLHLEAFRPIIKKGNRDISLLAFVGPTYQKSTLAIRTDDFLVNNPDEVVSDLGLSTGVGFRGRTPNWVVSIYGNLIVNENSFQGGGSD